MNKKTENGKLFGKWNELVLMFVGFILTVVVGGLISMMIQNRTWDHQNSETIRREEINNAQVVYEDVSSAIDSRIYFTNRVVWGHLNKMGSDELNERFNKYDNALVNWNTNLNRRQALLNRYFGPHMRKVFEYQIHDKFRIISNQLDSLIRSGTESLDNYKNIQTEIDNINTKIYGYNNTLLNMIKKEEIGRLSGNSLN